MVAGISFMGANLVAQQLDWNMTDGGWAAAERATNQYYAPLDTFAARFDDFLADVVRMGFAWVDVWTPQLNGAWATDEHLATARDVIDRRGVRVASYAGGFGATEEEFTQACRVASSLGTRILGGSAALLATDRATVVDALESSDLVLAIENHPERNPAELIAQIGDGAGGRIGAAVDTGWWATQGFDAARAIEELAGSVLYIHLKDVRAVGGHDTCRYGEGVVPLRECVAAAHDAGYGGVISVEHEPETGDPRDDCVASRQLLEEWLTEYGEWASQRGPAGDR
jgi:sugar phosphate isomerase/epimerase